MTEKQIQEIMKDELLMEIIEEEAAKYEITVDYYIQEFALWWARNFSERSGLNLPGIHAKQMRLSVCQKVLLTQQKVKNWWSEWFPMLTTSERSCWSRVDTSLAVHQLRHCGGFRVWLTHDQTSTSQNQQHHLRYANSWWHGPLSD